MELRVRQALSSGDDFRARYVAQKLFAAAPGAPETFRTCLLVAERSYAARSFLTALEFYKNAVAGFDAGSAAARPDLDRALLRAAEISLYHDGDARSAAAYFRRIDRRNIAKAELPLLRALRVRLSWSALGPDALGLADGNVSTLAIDGDDLWVGTWSGGVARYSVSARRSDAFAAPAYPRTIAVGQRRIWIGGAEGLSWFGKGTGTWGSEKDFQLPAARRVQALKLAGGILYAGTLGDGLYRLGPDGWAEVNDGGLPGPFVTSIEEGADGKELYLGTMSYGLVIMDTNTGSMRSLSDIAPGFSASNVTSLLDDGQGWIWIGTYGDGLYQWTPGASSLRHFSKATGEIGDDWVLASCRTGRGLYFGTFGGGVSVFFPAPGTWRRYGITDGLGSLDVAAIAWRAPFVFFGTLGAGVSVYDEESDGP
ncbi:MAG TPA: two-component regulator propeller domain-containing protein [Spirochaetia bacterium]|nr:two-component regulator propeller domain-containing protein [Spirochaetia bacterium]